jgi:hypothetical protein
MKYQDTIDYPVSSDALLNYFTVPEFFVHKYREQGATNIQVETHSHEGNDFAVTISRDVPVPAFARGIVPDTITLVQTDRWDTAARTGRLEIRFKGLPVVLTAAMRLHDTAAGARETLDFDIRVAVPLLGRKLEELLASDLRLKFQRDTAATLDIIAA